MAPNGGALSAVVVIFFGLLLNSSPCYSVQSDIDCLLSIRESMKPNNIFSSWNFENKTEGSICKFAGIECWHPDESKVLNIQLTDVGLEGELPPGFVNCSSMTGLDLSRNKLHGNLSSNISRILPYVVNLDLSFNQFSGEIPVNLANCTYLNVLNLNNNQFAGQIPLQIGQLHRIKTFNVANNKLEGPVPNFSNITVPAENYANNVGLCGGPLPRCQEAKEATHIGIIV